MIVPTVPACRPHQRAARTTEAASAVGSPHEQVDHASGTVPDRPVQPGIPSTRINHAGPASAPPMTQLPSTGANRSSDERGGDQAGPAKVEIYTWRFCPFCIRAKGLLDRKRVNYSEYLIDGDETARQAMARRADGRSTLPQIFINNRGIGGCDDLFALDQKGLLDSLLGIAS